ncbi:MAG: GNAT family N-acetyltransferase [Clostridia bacterium]|nr:GNAT family N-acetyltransferase [Clostridia bacterium]MBQ8290133.1 GNAT family N-acetyltransferase [Clostridia bacterium]
MKVTIRRFLSKDISKKVEWINNPDNNTYLHYDLPLEEEKTRAWFEKNFDRTDRFDAVIEVDGVAVGLIGLLSIDKRNLKAEFYICIGETGCKGKGVAKQSSKLLLDYAFNELKLNKVYLYTEVDNISAQRLFERVGFEKEGLLREDLIYRGRKVDRFVYGITRLRYEELENRD